MNRILLLLFLLPFFSFSQVDLVKWDNPDTFAANVLNTNITSAVMSAGPGINLSILNDVGFSGTKWPIGNFIDSSKYIQISITAKAGYKVDLTSLKYAFHQYDDAQGCRKYQVRYSKNSSTSDIGTLLVEELSLSSTKKTNRTITFPAGTFLLPGETMYIRFYGYDRGNTGWDDARWGLLNSHTQNNDGTYFVPTITGTVTAYTPTLKANDDSATTLKNNFTFINVLANDTKAANPNPVVNIASNPTNSAGTAVVNTDNTIKFTPTTDFTGSTSFTYTINDGTANTSTATVNVTVNNQTIYDLVKWDKPYAANPTIYATPAAAVSAGNITGSNVNLQLNNSNEGYKSFPWPTNFSIDETKYIEFTLAATTGYKLKLSAFNFTYKANANIKRYQVRYSLDDFATSTVLADEQAATTFTNKSLSLSTITLYPGATVKPLKIRIYAYKLTPNTWSDSPLDLWTPNLNAEAQNTTPTITGTVLLYDTNDLNANDDVVATKINKPVSFNVLENDINYAGATITYTQPPAAAGVVTNNSNILTFTPANGYIGNTTFTYTLTQGSKTSTATVHVAVNEIVPSLIIWNGAVQQPTGVVTNSNIIAGNLTVIGGDLSIYSNYFNGVNMGTTAINLNKYIQVNVTPKLNYKITFSQFKFIYNTLSGNQGATKYQVRYSIDPNFTDGGSILVPETNTIQGSDQEVLVNFPAGVVASSTSATQTFYIRIYAYGMIDTSNNNPINIKLKNDYGGEVGPTISGIVDFANVLTANPDTATTEMNTPVPISVLLNDEGYAALQNITFTQPPVSEGVVTKSNNILTFTPATGYLGNSTFTYTLFNGTAYSSANVTVTVIPAAIKTAIWDGTSWINNILPTADTNVIIRGDYTPASRSNVPAELLVNLKDLMVESGKQLVITSSDVIVINGNISNAGTINIKNGGSLIQTDDMATYAETNTTASFNVERITTPLNRYDYTYWSSPVSGQTLKNLSPDTLSDKYFEYNPLTGWVYRTGGNYIMAPGIGYMVRAPQTNDISGNPVAFTANFKGAPNNGIYSVAVKNTAPTSTTSNFLGNPYPSALSADQLYIQNKDLIKGTFYFWTNTYRISSTPDANGKYQYNAANYISYNATGSTNPVDTVDCPTCGGQKPDGNIATGQGFFVEAKSSGTLVFNNSMRVQTSASNSSFYKPSKTQKQTATIEKNRVWLNLKNANGAYNEMLLGYITGATNNLDDAYDGESYASGNALYTVLGGQNLVIQGRALPFDEKEVIQLGFATDSEVEYSIGIESFDGFFENQDVFLNDKTNNTITNLSEGRYKFMAKKGTFNDRFTLTFSKKKVDVPVVTEPEVPVVTEPETPGNENPTTEEPTTETPVVTNPETPSTENPTQPETPTTETPIVTNPDTPTTENPTTEEPTTGTPTQPENPTTETPVVTNPDTPTTENPTTEEPATGTPTQPETPVVTNPETPSTESPTTETPVVTNPDTPTTENPNTDNPSAPVVVTPGTPSTETPTTGDPGVIIPTPGGDPTLGIPKNDQEIKQTIIVYRNNANQIEVLTTEQNIKSVYVFDLLGRSIFAKEKVNNMSLIINELNTTNQMVLVKIQTEDDKIVTKKIILH